MIEKFIVVSHEKQLTSILEIPQDKTLYFSGEEKVDGAEPNDSVAIFTYHIGEAFRFPTYPEATNFIRYLMMTYKDYAKGIFSIKKIFVAE